MAATRGELMEELFTAGPAGRLLKGGEVAVLFQVSERTVLEWSRRGRIPTVRNPRGIRRYPADAVMDLLRAAGESGPPT